VTSAQRVLERRLGYTTRLLSKLLYSPTTCPAERAAMPSSCSEFPDSAITMRSTAGGSTGYGRSHRREDDNGRSVFGPSAGERLH